MVEIGIVRKEEDGGPRSSVQGEVLLWSERFASYTRNKQNIQRTRGVIHAEAHLGLPIRIDTVRQFRRHWAEHQVSLTTEQLPYKRCYCLPILNLRKIRTPFVHPRGAITLVRYRPPT